MTLHELLASNRELFTTLNHLFNRPGDLIHENSVWTIVIIGIYTLQLVIVWKVARFLYHWATGRYVILASKNGSSVYAENENVEEIGSYYFRSSAFRAARQDLESQIDKLRTNSPTFCAEEVFTQWQNEGRSPYMVNGDKPDTGFDSERHVIDYLNLRD